jgi:nucleotide-binding universal stress UspA family protein
MTHPFTIDRVLLATDLSPASEPALRCATALARRFNADLYLLHVVQAASRASPVTDAAAQQAAAAMRRLRQEVLAAQDKFATTAILTGDPVARILQKAEDVHADLIVMGTSARRPKPGGLTDAVVRRASCPVLTVPQAHQKTTELRT